MTTIDTPRGVAEDRPYHERYKPAAHFRSKEAEFDACKLGMWLFLATEILTFSGMFCGYAVFRMMYPQAFANGSHYLDPFWGGLNTVILLYSSFTIAMSIHNAQKNQQFWLKVNLAQTIVCALLFVIIKVTFEYTPKWSGYFFVLDPALSHHVESGKTAFFGLFHYVEGYGGKRPGSWFEYAYAENAHEPIWWSVYYVSTAIHAFHVMCGVVLISWLLWRAQKKHFGPGHYTAVEIVGLFWHIVDIVWIFLFPLLYLIH